MELFCSKKAETFPKAKYELTTLLVKCLREICKVKAAFKEGYSKNSDDLEIFSDYWCEFEIYLEKHCCIMIINLPIEKMSLLEGNPPVKEDILDYNFAIAIDEFKFLKQIDNRALSEDYNPFSLQAFHELAYIDDLFFLLGFNVFFNGENNKRHNW